MSRVLCGFVAATFVLLAGCTTEKAASKQLGRVAKDWSLMMRASQVIPIYPMSEDVQVGDLFVVQTAIGEEVALYESAKGFLPFDNHVKRLDPLKYKEFYPRGIYGVEGDVRPPAHWQFGPTTRPWVAAPQAAFPTFSFSVQRGGGATLALPVKSVPVGLGLLGAQSVDGQLTIADAYTYGIDRISLQQQVTEWAKGDEGQKALKNFAPYEIERASRRSAWGGAAAPQRRLVVNYLRVVSRVYAAHSVTVSLTNAQQAGANIAISNPLGTDLLGAATHPAESYEGLLGAINANLTKATTQPTDSNTIGSVKVASISRRSVSMAETFPRPLVIGYVGFDFPILAEGELGEGIPTRARLEQVLARTPSERIHDWLYIDRARRVPMTMAWLKEHGEPEDVVSLMYGVRQGDDPRKDSLYMNNLRLAFIRDNKVP
ncbi:MAG: hypothetical protein QOF78_3980 [Phycisphaerales bacterium]|nr:hypothetical protein [Phycisphaerales bacterium]